MGASTEAERANLVAKALEAADAKANAERMRLSWRSGYISATVVELPVDKVMLNPHSHRIRAQLESSADRLVVEAKPFSPEGQAVIEELLRQADEFQGLKANLADVGQIEPGVVTATGMLINANTRCVALRDNGQKYIRAGVLPSDATPEEIDRLELRLQVKRDFHSDYTFTNELLFVEDLVRAYRYSPEDIAVEMGWASRSDQRTVNRMAEQARSYSRILSLIREVQHMSGEKIPTVSFDSKRQALMELDQEVERRRNSDYAEAREVRDARLVGILAGAGYRELRDIGPEFVDQFLVPAIQDRPSLSPHVDALTKQTEKETGELPPGLQVLLAPSPTAQEPRRSAAALLEIMTSNLDQDTVTLTTADGDERKLDRGLFYSELRTVIEGAVEDVRLDREAGDLLNRPRDLVRKATKQTQVALEAYRSVADNPEFDRDRLLQAVDELGSAQASLKSLIDDTSSS